MNLRATYFEQLESILAELTTLIKRNEKLAKHNIYVKRTTAGLKRIKKAIWRIVEYSGDNQLYYLTIGNAANHLNVLSNLLRSGQLKEEISALYWRCIEILGRDFQLHLFGVGEEFGWAISIEEFEKPALKVFDWVKRFLSCAREQVRGIGRQLWQSIEGKQLTLADCRREVCHR
jgi:hypothetical protein